MAVAFHSNDRIWIIDAEADVGEAVEEGIRKFWDKGIRDARVRERHCREIRLKGDPCKSTSRFTGATEAMLMRSRDEPQDQFFDLVSDHPPGYSQAHYPYGQRLRFRR